VFVEELKADASSVTLGLGDGQYEHLSLLITSIQYATMSTQPFSGQSTQDLLIHQNRVLKPRSMQLEMYARRGTKLFT